MRRFVTITFSLMLAICVSGAFAEEKSSRELKKIAKEQQGIREMRDETLADLYKEKPSTRGDVENSQAVAVFSSLGMNLFLISTARGGGIVRETSSGNETFMRMFSVGGGFGFGVKDFRVVFIFHTRSAFDNFLNSGWDFSAQADAGAKSGDKGLGEEAVATVVEGVSLYQLTEAGVALQATLQGTKYYKDEDLN